MVNKSFRSEDLRLYAIEDFADVRPIRRVIEAHGVTAYTMLPIWSYDYRNAIRYQDAPDWVGDHPQLIGCRVTRHFFPCETNPPESGPKPAP